ncbi:hypothetical protein FRACYDRAFT_245705 [Fragilariopsis cylindrus CCMP1102]|uniref:Uncharacterized protein n=1 Tax=Fragilariopsis cylindrus CCMP1102 TaxID=635003 RepID=A0A1E7EZJ6_9STRA|nr:hypothetical protein FRACYDRAFT_245705 [Fragilariopsis cylindrus CCMP1102]|eukprot:OEU11351.1 hypothetical protein FRACYDRAFT_245705 [Fragilariopsis cylindrus CCMP1102]
MASSTVNEMSNSKSKSNMEELSREIHIAIASFLGVTDVVNYQSCTKQLRRMINLHRLNRPSPIGLIGSKFQTYGSVVPFPLPFPPPLPPLPPLPDLLQPLPPLPPLLPLPPLSPLPPLLQGVDGTIHLEEIIGSSFYFSHLIHSVKLSCIYRDQGWGNRKGQIYITEKSNQELQQSERDYKDVGRIIAESPLAEHHETKCELIFKPKPGFMYCLCYRFHTLIVRDIKLESFIHSACIPLANILMDTLHAPTSQQSLFHRNMLQYVLDTVVYFDNNNSVHCQQQQQEILLGRRPSLSFFQSVGLNLMDEHEVEAVRMLLTELESN